MIRDRFSWADVRAGWIDYKRTRRLGIKHKIKVRYVGSLDYQLGWHAARLLRRGAEQ
jgi:hypothetical protein